VKFVLILAVTAAGDEHSQPVVSAQSISSSNKGVNILINIIVYLMGNSEQKSQCIFKYIQGL